MRLFRWILSILILIYGATTYDLESWRWGALGICLFSMPLLLQIPKRTGVNVWALWGGVFLVLQSAVSPAWIVSDLVTLRPNTHAVVNVRGGIPGITGEQTITTDSKGFRTTSKIDYNSSASYRIFAIGASTTECIYLDDRKTWPHVLQEELGNETGKNVEVVNTGVAGLRAINHLATLYKILPLHPDLVIFLVGVNDWNYLIKHHFSSGLGNWIAWMQGLRDKMSLSNSMLGMVMHSGYWRIKQMVIKDSKPEMKEDYGEYFSSQRNSLNRPIKYSFRPTDVYADYKKQLSRISAVCHENNVRCIFITQPTGYQRGATEEFKRGFWMTPPNQPYTLDFQSMVEIASLYNSFLIHFAEEHNDDVCDAASKMDPSFDNFYDDCHFNAEGAHKMGLIVSGCVSKYVK